MTACDSFVDRHVAYCRAVGRAPGTIVRRRMAVARLITHLHTTGKHLGTANDRDLTDWQESLTCGVDGRRGLTGHVRSFWKWALDHELVDPRALRGLPMPKVPRRLPRPITEVDLTVALINAPERLRPWLLLAALAGLRACEIATLRAEDLDLSEHPAVTVRGKGAHVRTVPIGQGLAQELRQLPLIRRGWLFPKYDQALHTPAPYLGHVSESQVSHLACRYLHATGSVSTLHALRHRFATDVYRETLDLLLVRDLLGHRSVQTTVLYTQVVQLGATDVVERLAQRRLTRHDASS